MEKNQIPDLHDWEITGLDICRETKNIVIRLWFPDTEETAQLFLEGVSRLSCSGVMLQNVILDFLVFESNLESDYLKHCYKKLGIDSSVFEIRDSDEKNKVLLIEPSVGMELACCYRSMMYGKLSR